MSEINYFTELNNINVNDKTETKNGLTYLSWAYCWAELKKHHPDANYLIYENAQGWNYHTDGKTCWVKTGVIVNDIEHIEYLPVMDFKNKSIPAENVTSFDVNKAIQRALTKACARHGLGLYIYAGEDLPEEEAAKNPERPAPQNDRVQEADLRAKVLGYINKVKMSKESIDKICEIYKVKDIKDMDVQKCSHLLNTWKKKGVNIDE